MKENTVRSINKMETIELEFNIWPRFWLCGFSQMTKTVQELEVNKSVSESP